MKKIVKYFSTLFITSVLLLPYSVAADTFSIVPFKCQGKSGCNACDFILIFVNAANLIAGVLGTISLLMFVVGGIFWIISDGNEQRVETGKKILTGTVTGLFIVFFAWFTVNFVVRLAYYGSLDKNTNEVIAGEKGPQIFSSAWWEPPVCDKSADCIGKYIGMACSQSGDCTGSDSDACVCYRAQDPKGDDFLCVDSTETLNEDVNNPAKQTCFCASMCRVETFLENDPKTQWECTVKSSVLGNPELYNVDESLDCPVIGEVCVDLKN